MKHSNAYFLAVLGIPFTLGLAALADDVSFHPAKDFASQKELRIDAELAVKEASISFNGEPVPADSIEQLTAQQLMLSIAIDVTETFRATKDGAPVDLLRGYDKIELKLEIGDEVQEPEGDNDLEGKSVQFLWDAKESEYKKSFHESKGDDALLESLDADMEVRALLPDKKVGEGDTWDVSGDDLAALFFPGGIAAGGGDGSGEGPDVEAITDEFAKQLETAFKEFKVTCTYTGTRDAAGTKVGEITFVYDGKASLDLDPILKQAEEMGGGGIDMEFSSSASMTLRGEGALLWDLATGVMYTYEMKAELGLDVNIEAHAQQEGMEFDVSMSGSIGGDVTWAMTRK